MDTGAWIALRVRDDRYHVAAGEAWVRLLASSYALLTTNLVVGETYTYLRQHYGFDVAWRLLEELDRSRRLTPAHVTPEEERDAYAILRQYRDHAFSFVDATSFALMRSLGLTYAFAFDVHFAIAGFTRIPVDAPVP